MIGIIARVTLLAGACIAVGGLTAGCGGSDATNGPAASTGPPASSAPAAASPSPDPTSSGSAVPTSPSSGTGSSDAFVADFHAKVERGDFTPPTGVKKNVDAAKDYMDDLSDDRLVLAGQAICTASKQGLSKADFVTSVTQNPGTEKGFLQLTPLVWDEASALLCTGG